MIIPIKIQDNIDLDDIEIENKSFKSLCLKEENIEEFLRKNIEVLIDDETLLVVGRQVTNKENGRSDLTAVDEDGNLVLIEIKRDIDDIKLRKEPFEFQAIRYAASYAKIKSVDELVDKVFADYIEKYKEEFDLGALTANEKAVRVLSEFLEKNNATKTFNQNQRIILIASTVDPQTLSAVAWLISNNVDISCFSLSPLKIGDGLFIEINKVLPPQMIEDFYVDIHDQKKPSTLEKTTNSITRTYLPRMDKLFEWGLIKKDDTVEIKNFENSEAKVNDSRSVVYQGETMTYNQWGEKVTRWSAVNIYEWTLIKGDTRTLDQLRKEKMKEESEK